MDQKRFGTEILPALVKSPEGIDLVNKLNETRNRSEYNNVVDKIKTFLLDKNIIDKKIVAQIFERKTKNVFEI